MRIARQIRRRQERKKKKERKKLIKKLGLSDFEYVADDKNMTFSASMPQMIDFLRVIGFEDIFDRHVRINKRKSPYSSSKIGELLVLQNILGIERIESSRKLAQDAILKSKLYTKVSYSAKPILSQELSLFVVAGHIESSNAG